MKLVKVLALADLLLHGVLKSALVIVFLLAMYRYGGDYFFATSNIFFTHFD